MSDAQPLGRINVTFARRSLAYVESKPRAAAARSASGISAYRNWCARADAVGFPAAGMSMVLELTPDEIVVHSATFVRARPKRRAGALLLKEIAQITTARSVTKTHIVIAFDDGGIIELEAMSGRRARRFVAAVLDQRDRPPWS